MGMITEFKEFAMKGNLVDMAVGFIMGGAFATVVKSFVDDIIMPPIGLLLGGVDFANLAYVLKPADAEAGTEAVAISYGLFINNAISFLIVALAVFFVIKGMNNLKKKEEEAPAEPAAPPAQEVLLAEIRDLLKK
ncbi:large-conductance mechanosensitive channel protein MscL [Hirschia baltica]|uniref:Large-conductance mechanosensitive channel n=1 Tax=Hirschia baltica (strain ATCC 49814 / DSM 5838 / IFAM 1418) TaxID=582402 RepID=C6XN84_HIRBI|nr:large-conductance mechanosensitive channel protein MscL [Hirschia baltica]ACT60028.1 large conductance mechanosensitive channel protein [Hirschia baltica ATCC 49814]